MINEHINEVIEFINKNNLNDIFVYENWFYNNFGVNLYTYLRVSTEKQEFGRQIIGLYDWAKQKQIKIYIKQIYCDKYTGTKLNRKNYNYVRKLLKEQDYFLNTDLSRLGRDYEGVKKEWYYFKYKDIKILISDNQINEYISAPLPFEKKEATLDRLYLQDIIFLNTIFKNSLKILEVSSSTKSGMKKAKINGTKTGRPIGKPRGKNTSKELFIDILKMLVNGEQLKKALEITKFPKRTYYNWLENYKDYYNTNDLKKIIEHLESEGK